MEKSETAETIAAVPKQTVYLPSRQAQSRRRCGRGGTRPVLLQMWCGGEPIESKHSHHGAGVDPNPGKGG